MNRRGFFKHLIGSLSVAAVAPAVAAAVASPKPFVPAVKSFSEIPGGAAFQYKPTIVIHMVKKDIVLHSHQKVEIRRI
jgi:hypothetical protein